VLRPLAWLRQSQAWEPGFKDGGVGVDSGVSAGLLLLVVREGGGAGAWGVVAIGLCGKFALVVRKYVLVVFVMFT